MPAMYFWRAGITCFGQLRRKMGCGRTTSSCLSRQSTSSLPRAGDLLASWPLPGRSRATPTTSSQSVRYVGRHISHRLEMLSVISDFIPYRPDVIVAAGSDEQEFVAARDTRSKLLLETRPRSLEAAMRLRQIRGRVLEPRAVYVPHINHCAVRLVPSRSGNAGAREWPSKRLGSPRILTVPGRRLCNF